LIYSDKINQIKPNQTSAFGVVIYLWVLYNDAVSKLSNDGMINE
jgi:hypothetical protein